MIRLILVSIALSACTPSSRNTSAVRTAPRQSAVRQTSATYRVSKDVYRTVPSPHHPDYLARGISYEAIASLKSQIEAREGDRLIDRGEAHMTVVTPPEFSRLKTKMTMAEVEWLARDNGFYEAPFQIACLGRATKGADKTYFLVASSPVLLNVRRIIEKEFRARGGSADAFQADRFFPHVTVGYSQRDLHEGDGAVKDVTSCIGGVRVVEGLLTR